MRAFLYKQSFRYARDPVDMALCREAVSDGPLTASWHQCKNKGIVDRDGVMFCKKHDPAAIEAKLKAREERYEAERKASAAKYRLDAAAPDLLAFVDRFLEAMKAKMAVRQLSGDDLELYNMAQAVRAKAEGSVK